MSAFRAASEDSAERCRIVLLDSELSIVKTTQKENVAKAEYNSLIEW